MHLVTGASGLVGSHLLIHLLKKEERVKAIFRNESSKKRTYDNFARYGAEVLDLFQKIKWVQGDVLDILSLSEAMEQVKFVYHCAAMVSFKKSDQALLIKTNVEGTKNVVNVCLNSSIEKLCHVSSTAAIGTSLNKDRAHEGLAWKKEKNTSNYSISKYQAEMEVWRGMEEGLNAVIVNPCIILGPADWERGSAELFTKVWKGLKFYTLGKNAFVDVRDVVLCMDRLMQSEISSERFLVCGENLSYRELFNCIAKYLKKSPPNTQVKPCFLAIIWRLEALRSFLLNTSPLVTKETAHTSMSIKTYDNSKIRKALNFEFTPVEEAIKHTAGLFLSNMT